MSHPTISVTRLENIVGACHARRATGARGAGARRPVEPRVPTAMLVR